MTVKFTLNSREVPDGTILLFGVRYPGEPEHRPFSIGSDKVYTYAMLKAGGFWYVTGGGKTPQAAGWGAIERWLERDGRVVEWVQHVTATAQLWPPVPPQVRVHAFEASHSGMVCGAMVQGPDGTGDQCGKPAGDPVHGEDLSDSDQRRYRDEEPRSESRRCPCGLTGFAAPELHRPGCTGEPAERHRGTEWRDKTRTPEDDALGRHND